MILRCASLFTGAHLLSDVTVVVEGRRIQAARRAEPGDPPPVDGVVIPGLVNAHLHLELSGLAGRVEGGAGLVPWVRQVMKLREGHRASAEELAEQARQLVASGTAAVCDISSDGQTAEILAEAGLSGVVQHEHLGLDRSRLGANLASIASSHRVLERGGARVEVRPAPHALYSTAPTLIRACMTVRADAPSSIHLAEDPAERELLQHREGPFARLLEELEVDWRWWDPPGPDPVSALRALGALGSRMLVVHGVDLKLRERAELAQSGATLVLCPRSNRHIGRLIPEVPGLLRSGMRLALGSDSLASSDSLDVLGEVHLLLGTFPALDPAVLLRAATWGGAKALGLRHLGRVDAGASPGLVQLGMDSLEDLREGLPRERRWLLRPDGRPPEPVDEE